MPFDLKNLNPTARFYWGSGKKEWVELRNIPIGVLDKIRKETISRNVEYYRPEDLDEKDRQNFRPFRYEVKKVNEDLLNELLWDYQIVNWNITDPDGNEIPCTKENKLLLMGNSAEFADWIVRCLNQMASDEIKRKEKSEKN